MIAAIGQLSAFGNYLAQIPSAIRKSESRIGRHGEKDVSDPSILFIKPKAISQRDKKALQAAGVVVVEVDDPQSVRLVKANAELDGSALLRAAAKAISESGYQTDVKAAFGKALCAALLHQQTPGA